MHLQSTYTPHLLYLQSEARLESIRISAVKLFCRNSQRFNPNLGRFLGIRFEGAEKGGWGGKITPPCLKLIRVMLET